MAKVDNKFTPFFKNADGSPIGYISVIRNILGHDNGKTMNIDQIRERFKLIERFEKAIEKKEESISLSKDELALVKRLVLSNQWPIVHKDIIEFVDYVESLK